MYQHVELALKKLLYLLENKLYKEALDVLNENKTNIDSYFPSYFSDAIKLKLNMILNENLSKEDIDLLLTIIDQYTSNPEKMCVDLIMITLLHSLLYLNNDEIKEKILDVMSDPVYSTDYFIYVANTYIEMKDKVDITPLIVAYDSSLHDVIKPIIDSYSGLFLRGRLI